MATPTRPRIRAQLVLLAAAVVIGVVGAVIWSNVVADESGPPDVVLTEPGEYILASAATNPPVTGTALPDVALTADDGAAVRLRGDGRPMVVNLWFSTCAPCARELREFAAVEADLGDEVRFVGVNPQDDSATMNEFAAARGVDYELLRDTDLAFTDGLGVAVFPSTLFVDADGRIVGTHGALDGAELRGHLRHYFGLS